MNASHTGGIVDGEVLAFSLLPWASGRNLCRRKLKLKNLGKPSKGELILRSVTKRFSFSMTNKKRNTFGERALLNTAPYWGYL